MSAKTIVLVIYLMSFGTWTHAADCNNGGRYEVMNDGTVQDCRTGLIWLKDADCRDSLGLPGIDKSLGRLEWYDALKWVAALHSGHCGLFYIRQNLPSSLQRIMTKKPLLYLFHNQQVHNYHTCQNEEEQRWQGFKPEVTSQ